MRALVTIALPGLLALLIGHGIGRFAYTPLIPTLVEAGWATPAEAFYLGAGNLAGYLIGALTVLWAAKRFGAASVIRLALLLVLVGTAVCALPFGFWFWLPWRVGTGIAGAFIIILAASATLARSPIEQRGKIAGIMFAGIGIGTMLSGTLVPIVASYGPVTAWLSLAALVLAALPLAWGPWPARGGPAPPKMRWSFALVLVSIGYIADAIGFIPHSVFLVDYVARGLGLGLAQGGTVWVAFGIGAMVGPLLAGLMADKIGFPAAFAAVLVMKGLSVGMILTSDALPVLLISAAVTGALTPGIAVVASGTALVFAGVEGHMGAWRTLTVIFAAAQGLGGWAYSSWFAQTHEYRGLFWSALIIFAVGASAAIVAARLAPKRVPA